MKWQDIINWRNIMIFLSSLLVPFVVIELLFFIGRHYPLIIITFSKEDVLSYVGNMVPFFGSIVLGYLVYKQTGMLDKIHTSIETDTLFHNTYNYLYLNAFKFRFCKTLAEPFVLLAQPSWPYEDKFDSLHMNIFAYGEEYRKGVRIKAIEIEKIVIDIDDVQYGKHQFVANPLKGEHEAVNVAMMVTNKGVKIRKKPSYEFRLDCCIKYNNASINLVDYLMAKNSAPINVILTLIYINFADVRVACDHTVMLNVNHTPIVSDESGDKVFKARVTSECLKFY